MPRASASRLVRVGIIAFVVLFFIYKISSSAGLSQAVGYHEEGGHGDHAGQEVKAEVKESKPEQTEEKAEEKADKPADKTEAKAEQAEEKPAKSEGYQRANATFVSLARNEDVWQLVKSIREVEDRFNHQFHYDWVFLNDGDFDDEFKRITTALVSGTTKYGKIPKEHWGFPDWIDQDRAGRVREEMRRKQIIYGDSVSYRHMCRFESGFFFRHPLLQDYKYYWRVEPSIQLFCDVSYDVFKFMEENNKDYGFTLSLYEYIETIPTLWDSVKNFTKQHPEYVAENNLMKWLSDDGGETYNKCHFWSNFEVGNLDFWRGKAYMDFFEHLDHDGGFFYERWGDAPVHSIAAGLFLPQDRVHYFEDIGYWHVPFTNCPTNQEDRTRLKCSCNPRDNFSWKGYSCTPRYHDVTGRKRPEQWHEQS
ncbi:nucleotide-diphospho-sugar transferase [Dipodascopsis tothii]|uniref:nucleotide-diphospho-sugar transferase n=1 Tax=Dipodascopsis tothii TaxID=44089 RepID=UPI0034CDD708